jgi:hypothetical protein
MVLVVDDTDKPSLPVLNSLTSAEFAVFAILFEVTFVYAPSVLLGNVNISPCFAEENFAVHKWLQGRTSMSGPETMLIAKSYLTFLK